MRIPRLVFAAALLLLSPSAFAQGPSVHGSLGFGEVSVNDNEADLDPSFGLSARYEADLHPRFVLGVGGRILSWIGDEAADEDSRNTLIDIVIRPTLQIPIDDRLRFRAALMLGPSYSLIGEDAFTGGSIDPALGFHVGLGVGTRIAMSPGLDLDFELAYVRHDAEHEAESVIGSIDIDGQVTHFLLTVGVAFGP